MPCDYVESHSKIDVRDGPYNTKTEREDKAETINSEATAKQSKAKQIGDSGIKGISLSGVQWKVP
jgi:hypothetical protein